MNIEFMDNQVEATDSAEKRKLFHIADETRKKMAQTIHDSVGGNLVAIRLHATHIRDHKDTTPALKELANIIDTLVEDSHKAVHGLEEDFYPNALKDGSFIEALKSICHTTKKAMPNTVFKVSIFDDECDDIKMTEEVSSSAYFFLKESITNIGKHAGQPTEVAIFFSANTETDQWILAIDDNGDGFKQSETNQKAGRGLHGMQDRADALDAVLIIESSPGNGTNICLTIPMETKT